MLGWKLITSVTVAAIGTLMTVTGLDSGPAKGEAVSAFQPTHVTGADKGTNTCPVCKYGVLPAVQVWVNGVPSEQDAKVAQKLEQAMAKFNTGDKLRLKSFMIFKGDQSIEGKLQQFAKLSRIEQVALAYLPGSSEAFSEYHINPEAKTTVLVYKGRRITDKFVDLPDSADSLKQLESAIDRIEK